MSKSNIARQLAQVQPGTLHAGVDLALEKNVGVVINEKAERLDHFSFPQDRGGYDYFLRRLEGLRQKYQASEVVVAMEPSNYFWKLLARELEEKKTTYHLVNAYTVKKHREGDQLDRSKDDRRDADQIAEISRNGNYTETRLQKGAYEDLRQYATLHDQLVQGIRREKHVLWGLVGQAFPELSQVFKNLVGETGQALLMTGASAAIIRQLTVEDFIVQVRAAYSGKKLHVSKLHRVHQLAVSSIGVTEGLRAIQLAIQVHLVELQTFQKQLKRVTNAMTTCLATLPEAPYLLSVKSLQTVSAAIFLAEVGDPKRYQAAAQWVKLAGIQPAPNTSGKKQRSQTPMSHQGRARLRTMLFFTCLRMVRFDEHFAQIYANLQRRQNNPLTKMQALGVLMNKLLHILWALIHNQTFYNPSFGQSI
ncbi:MAG TPA: IS110 family transposase [Anaerolineales bacterium]